MKILITGSTGFVGRTVTKYLLEKGYEICLLVRDCKKMYDLFGNLKYDHISLKEPDWKNRVKEYNPTTILHLAAFFSGNNDSGTISQLITSNLSFPSELLMAVSETDCSCIINTGTFTEYKFCDGELCANNFYSATKTALRPLLNYFCDTYNWKWINVVVYSPYGRYNPNKKVIDYLVDAIDSEKPVAFTDGNQVLDFIHVDDMAIFYERLLSNLNKIPHKQQFHLGSGKGYSIKEIASVLESVYNRKVNANWGARLRNPYDISYAVAPIEANLKYLNWKSQISIEDGLRILKSDLLNHYE